MLQFRNANWLSRTLDTSSGKKRVRHQFPPASVINALAATQEVPDVHRREQRLALPAAHLIRSSRNSIFKALKKYPAPSPCCGCQPLLFDKALYFFKKRL